MLCRHRTVCTTSREGPAAMPETWCTGTDRLRRACLASDEWPTSLSADQAGILERTAVLNACSRHMTGWAMADLLRTDWFLMPARRTCGNLDQH